MPPKRNPAAGPVFSPRKTRSMAAGKRGAEAPAETAKKEAVEQKGKKRAKKEEAVGVEKEVAAPPPSEQKGMKKAKKEEEEKAPPPPAAKQKGRKRAKEADVEHDGDAVVQDGKRIVVEACTQCQHFKKRALKVKEDLESVAPGVSVVINPEKPRRGCLEIREEGGEVFISLLNMPRPFTAMKKLDMDEVIQEIVKKIS